MSDTTGDARATYHPPADFLNPEGGTLDLGGITREQAEAIAAQARETDPSLTVRWEGEPI